MGVDTESYALFGRELTCDEARKICEKRNVDFNKLIHKSGEEVLTKGVRILCLGRRYTTYPEDNEYHMVIDMPQTLDEVINFPTEDDKEALKRFRIMMNYLGREEENTPEIYSAYELY